MAGGVGIGADGTDGRDFVDRLGHGTAVTAAIREKALEAELYAVKVFDSELATTVDRLVRGIVWAANHRMRLINLSLGTAREAHAGVLREAVEYAASQGALVVSARDRDGARWLPGNLSGVAGVEVDWACDRHTCRVATSDDGATVFRASGYPRAIPGVAPARNLQGISFAVANVTGLLARALEAQPKATLEDLLRTVRAAEPEQPPA